MVKLTVGSGGGIVMVEEVMGIPEWLRGMLKEYGTTYDMARALDLREPTLNRWMNGRRIPSAPSCIKLAEATGTPVEQVLQMAYGGDEEMPPDLGGADR